MHPFFQINYPIALKKYLNNKSKDKISISNKETNNNKRENSNNIFYSHFISSHNDKIRQINKEKNKE